MSILQAGLKPVVHTHGSPSESAWVACGWGEAQQQLSNDQGYGS